MTESVAYPGGSARRQSIGEEVLNAISHGIGAVMASGTVLLVLRAKEERGPAEYHQRGHFWRLHDPSVPDLLPVSCAAPVQRKAGFSDIGPLFHFPADPGDLHAHLPDYSGGTFGLTIFGINLACGIVGIVLNAVSLKRWKKVSLVLYIVMGWLGILALPTIWRNMTLEGLCLLLLGGVAYTVGVIFYRQKEKPYRHGIWHFFVLAGTVLQFFAVYTNCCAG